ncbi:hypothetical protein P43SY_004039 [Pythium insidiosum]|uniref:Protein kinase domain-containing protein n=1 Tax=Pythium insidiosum TaxID=114742 RepID=A0AAD5LZ28_PYTIN|nr:hypothetical protein P43SY_004039 [Pythium insidiosum]
MLGDRTFRFDGSTSDLAQQFYRLHRDGVTLPSLPAVTVPSAVQKRLADAGLSFADLPGLLQRALLWDAGFAFDVTGRLVRIWTLDGRTMAEIAVPKSEFSNVCPLQTCSQPDNMSWYKSVECPGDEILRVARCVADEVHDANSDLSMWATGGNVSMTPEMLVYKHDWYDVRSRSSFLVHAIHTRKRGESPAYGQCSRSAISAYMYGALVIPCHPLSRLNSTIQVARMSEPRPGKIVAAWLKQVSHAGQDESSDDEGISTTTIAIIVVAAAIAAVCAAFAFCCWRRRRRRAKSLSARAIGNSGEDTYVAVDTAKSAGLQLPGSAGDQAGSKTSAWDDAVIAAVRIPFDKVVMGAVISRGGFGEVYRGTYNGQHVAIKRLLPERRRDLRQIERFLEEVKLNASLEHECIVRFVGVAWDSLSDLSVVSEFMEGGDLRAALARFDEQQRPTGFDAVKIKIALHVAHALTYLHSLRPMVLHRDLKSKNVLLNSALDAKLTDFGVARERADRTMTAGVGSSLWMAPEVMLGERYDEKADVFSFGVLLSELDTHKLPYAHAVEPGTGRKLPDTAVLQLVMLGRLSVLFTVGADAEMVALGRACVSVHSEERPTAAEVLHRVHLLYQEHQHA